MDLSSSPERTLKIVYKIWHKKHLKHWMSVTAGAWHEGEQMQSRVVSLSWRDEGGVKERNITRVYYKGKSWGKQNYTKSSTPLHSQSAKD